MTTFSDLGLSPVTVQAVADAGYTVPTPIQEQAIPVALTGKDVLGIAQTGTGKTAAFTLPMIDKLATGRAKARMPRSLVIAPTRELADQVAEAFDKYARNRKLTWALLIGGVSMGDQIAKLDRGVDVLIATPGRLLDLFGRGKVLLTGVQIMVVDEADRMLDMGFIPDIEEIFKKTPPSKQTLFFSATMPPEITRLTKQFLKDPVRIEVSRPATTADTIAQHIVRLKSSDPKAKREALRILISRADVQTGLVFCNRKSDVDVVAKSLKQHGFDAAPIHGDLDQSVRTRTLESFRAGTLKLLVASDVAARGLDIPAVTHVFNFDVPYHPDDYVHRIGRTGRAGRKGDTFMLVTPADEKNVDKVTKLIGMNPDEVTLDTGAVEGGARGGGRGRGAKPERAAKPEREAAPEPEPIAAEAAPDSNDGEEIRERPARRRRGGRGAKEAAQPAAEAPAPMVRAEQAERPLPAPPAPRQSEGRGRGRGDRSEARDGGREASGVVGFGDDVPAFLRR